MHVMVEGIDGSGKGTIINAFINAAHEKGLEVFDAPYISRSTGRLPELSDFKDADIVLTAEPTYAWIGKFIREEVIMADGRSYSPEFTALQYSSDRIAHYNLVVLPALEAGKIVLQDRGAPSSFCYQPIQDSGYPLERIVALEGNWLALQHQPDILFIATVSPKEAMNRLSRRKYKDDKAKFEKLEFLRMLQPRYECPDILPNLFNRSKIVYFNTERPIDEIKEEAERFAMKNIFI